MCVSQKTDCEADNNAKFRKTLLMPAAIGQRDRKLSGVNFTRRSAFSFGAAVPVQPPADMEQNTSTLTLSSCTISEDIHQCVSMVFALHYFGLIIGLPFRDVSFLH